MGHRDDLLCIEVVFALPDRQELVTLQLANGATVGEAIQRSSLQSVFPEWNLGECAVGIWGQPVERSRRLKQGDRVEIYRPLAINPREARRSLAAQGKSMGKPAAGSDDDSKGTEED